MNFRKATREELISLEVGSPIIINIKDKICDIGIFLGYNREDDKITVLDCFMRKDNLEYVQNITQYKECFVFPKNRENLIKLYQRKM